MKHSKSLLFVALMSLPLISFAQCDSNYANMFTYVYVENNLNIGEYISCSVTSMDGGWQNSTSIFNKIGSTMSTPTMVGDTACYDDSGDNDVSGTITCWSVVNSGGVYTRGKEIGTLSFHHDCDGSLNYYGAGSCDGSYNNGQSVDVVNTNYGINHQGTAGLQGNENSYTVHYNIYS